MMLNEYVAEKVRQVEEERLTRALITKREMLDKDERPRARPVIGPVVRAAGRTLRRAGAGIESWASPGGADGEAHLRTERRTG